MSLVISANVSTNSLVFLTPLFLHDCHIIRGNGTVAVTITGIIGIDSNFGFYIVDVSGVGLMVVVVVVVHFDEFILFYFLVQGQGQGTVNF